MSSVLRPIHLLLFALPAMVSAIMHGPVAGVIPSLYASDFALDLTVIGSALLIARLFDAITDPLIGFLSDSTLSRFGRRKPWIAVGAALTVIAIWFLFRPGTEVSTAYFLGFSLLLYLGWTVLEIPYVAWLLEISRDSRERTRLNASRTGALLVGGIIFYLLPALLPESSGRMTFQVLGVLAVGIAISVPITTALMLRFVPEGKIYRCEAPPRIGELWQSVRRNKPFHMFLLIYALIGLASGISGVLGFMFIDTYLGIGNRFTELFLPSVIIGPLTVPLWVWVMNRYGKYRSTALAFSAYALIMPMPWLLSPGENAFLPMLVYYTSLALFMPLLMISMPSILGDIIDFDELENGANRSGQYSAFLTLIAKGMTAVGGPLALVAVGLFGYQPGLAENSESAILGLRVIFNLLPPLLVIPAIALLWNFPISDQRQIQIAAELESRVSEETL